MHRTPIRALCWAFSVFLGISALCNWSTASLMANGGSEVNGLLNNMGAMMIRGSGDDSAWTGSLRLATGEIAPLHIYYRSAATMEFPGRVEWLTDKVGVVRYGDSPAATYYFRGQRWYLSISTEKSHESVLAALYSYEEGGAKSLGYSQRLAFVSGLADSQYAQVMEYVEEHAPYSVVFADIAHFTRHAWVWLWASLSPAAAKPVTYCISAITLLLFIFCAYSAVRTQSA